jgi:hypothetical protein
MAEEASPSSVSGKLWQNIFPKPITITLEPKQAVNILPLKSDLNFFEVKNKS